MKVSIDKFSKVPVYLQIADQIKSQIISGAQLPQQFQAAFINAVNTAPGATTMSTLLSQTIVNVSLSILSFMICLS